MIRWREKNDAFIDNLHGKVEEKERSCRYSDSQQPRSRLRKKIIHIINSRWTSKIAIRV